MPKGFYIVTKDIQRMISTLKDKGEEWVDIVEAEVAATANDIVRVAVQRVSAQSFDVGGLKDSIAARQDGAPGQWEVVAGVHYAAYIEFGTGEAVNIPPGLESYAKQFMAPRPVKREVNLPARPFFFNTLAEQEIELTKRLKDLLV